MSSLTDQYTKNKSDSEKRAFEKLVVKEMDGSISELSAIQLVLAKERENKNKGGIVLYLIDDIEAAMQKKIPTQRGSYDRK